MKSKNRVLTCGLSVALAAAVLSACQTPDGPLSLEGAESYEVGVESTPFYRLGPQQDSGPDLSLSQGTRVMLLRRGFGFSQVQIENGWDGWVATGDIRPASVLPPFPEAEAMRPHLVDIRQNPAILRREVFTELPAETGFDDMDFPPVDLATDLPEPIAPESMDLHNPSRPSFRY